MVGYSWEFDILPALKSGTAAVRLNRYRFARHDPGLAVEIHGLGPVEKIPEAFGQALVGAVMVARTSAEAV